MYKKKKIGCKGEILACEFLSKNGYIVLETNFKCFQGEIDIVAFDKLSEEIVFVEVKARTNFKYGFPAEAVDYRKRIHIFNSAKYYLFTNRLENMCCRIDVIEIVFWNGSFKLNHLKNVIE